MPASVFHRACLTHPGRIAGFRLRPFSCWHLMHLEALGNRFICGGERRIEDVVQVLLVCRDRYTPDARQPLPSFARFQDSRAVRAWLLARLALSPWQRLARRVELYLDAYGETPSYWAEDGASRSRVPSGMVVACRIMPLVGEDRAWNMPFSLACCYKAAMDERDGAKLADEDIAEAEKAFEKAGVA